MAHLDISYARASPPLTPSVAPRVPPAAAPSPSVPSISALRILGFLASDRAHLGVFSNETTSSVFRSLRASLLSNSSAKVFAGSAASSCSVRSSAVTFLDVRATSLSLLLSPSRRGMLFMPTKPAVAPAPPPRTPPISLCIVALSASSEDRFVIEVFK